MKNTKPASDRAAINRAKRLLEKNGYTITKCRPDPRIGDVVRLHEGSKPYDVLITFHQTDNSTPEEVQAHLAAEEKKRVPKFGDRVECGGEIYTVACQCEDSQENWLLVREHTDYGWLGVIAKRSEFTILDPHPPVEKES